MLSTFDNCKQVIDKSTKIDFNHLAILDYEQVGRLNTVMNEVVNIHGNGNFPTIEVRLCDLISMVRHRLCTKVSPAVVSVEQSTSWWPIDDDSDYTSIQVNNVRMNGGAALYVLTANSQQSYNDLDFIFNITLSEYRDFDRVMLIVLKILVDLLPEGVIRNRMTPSTIKNAYVGKMIKVKSDSDQWSLISLGIFTNQRNVELKFIAKMKRSFEFSVDAFQIILDSFLFFYRRPIKVPICKDFYPTVIGESMYGDFRDTMYHFHNKLIVTRNPEEIRGGGLLKYCNLLLRNYKPKYDGDGIKKLKQYMCSRFFIDFSNSIDQRIRLENYLVNHFCAPEDQMLMGDFLKVLRQVIKESTMSLMVYESQQSLLVIQDLLCVLKIEHKFCHCPMIRQSLQFSSVSFHHNQL